MPPLFKERKIKENEQAKNVTKFYPSRRSFQGISPSLAAQHIIAATGIPAH